MTDKLRRIAEAATRYDEGHLMRYEHGGGRIAILPVPGDGERHLIADIYHEADREFAITFNPSAVLALLDERDSLQATQFEDAPRAWEIWRPGAGSENSFTSVTRLKSDADRAEESGATVTPLYALKQRAKPRKDRHD